MADQQAAKVGKPPMMASDVNDNDSLCGCGYRRSLHIASPGGGDYCELAAERHRANVAEAELGRLHAELEKAQADVVRMATAKIGDKCEHHKSPLEELERLALRECPICWKACADSLQAELEKAQQERREPEDVAALRLKLGTELVNGLVARAEAAEAENRTLKDALTSACADAAFYGLKLSEAEAKLGEK